MARLVGGCRLEQNATHACHRHLGDRDEETAIGEIMTRDEPPGRDLGANKIAVAALCCQIDRWG